MWKYCSGYVKLCRKGSKIWPNDCILQHDNAPAHKALSVKQFLAQKSITEMEHPPHSPHLAPNNFCLFQKIKSALKGRRFQDTEDKKCDDDTESYSQLEFQNCFQQW
jgi:hypothetical protein